MLGCSYCAGRPGYVAFCGEAAVMVCKVHVGAACAGWLYDMGRTAVEVRKIGGHTEAAYRADADDAKRSDPGVWRATDQAAPAAPAAPARDWEADAVLLREALRQIYWLADATEPISVQAGQIAAKALELTGEPEE